MQPNKILLDTATLVPAVLRDLLLRLADKGLLEIYWSEDSLVELERTLIQKLKIETTKAQNLILVMQNAFPKSTILLSQYQAKLNQMQNHPKDRHVLAAAIVSKATIIVTPNLKDFPPTILEPLKIRALSPDMFLEQLFTITSDHLVEIIKEQSALLKNPPKTFSDTLMALKPHAPKTVSLLESTIKKGQDLI